MKKIAIIGTTLGILAVGILVTAITVPVVKNDNFKKSIRTAYVKENQKWTKTEVSLQKISNLQDVSSAEMFNGTGKVYLPSNVNSGTAANGFDNLLKETELERFPTQTQVGKHWNGFFVIKSSSDGTVTRYILRTKNMGELDDKGFGNSVIGNYYQLENLKDMAQILADNYFKNARTEWKYPNSELFQEEVFGYMYTDHDGNPMWVKKEK